MTITTQTGRTVRVTAQATGRNFGWVGIVKARNGRTLAITDVYGIEHAAEQAAARVASAKL